MRNGPQLAKRHHVSGNARPKHALPERSDGRIHFLDQVLRESRKKYADLWDKLEKFRPNYGHNLQRYLYSIARDFDKTKKPPFSEAEREIIRALIRILPEMGFVNSTVDMLALLDVADLASVLFVSNVVSQALARNRLGLDDERVRQWFATIRSAWNLAADDPDLSSVSRYQLHETLLGRHISLKQVLTEPEARLAAQLVMAKAVSLADPHEDDVARTATYQLLLRNAESVVRPGPGIVASDRLLEWRRSYRDHPLGMPMLASLISLKSGTSLVWVDGEIRQEWRPDWRLRGLTQTFIKNAKNWFRVLNRDLANQIQWPDVYVGIAKNLLQKMQAQAVPSTTLLLAVDPELDRVPWQHLFKVVADELGVRVPVVSLIPSFGWSYLASNTSTRRRGLHTKYCGSDDPEITETLRQITTIEAGVRKAGHVNSLAVVLGHGEPKHDPDSLPTVMVDGQPVSRVAWLTMSQWASVLIHSCGAAHGQAGVLGDVGSLVGLLLGGRCKAVVAPMGYIPIDAICAMHRSMLAEGSEIGAKLLAASAAQPAATLYCLYGDPYQQV